MIQLSDEQLNNLGKEALIVIVSSLQDQLLALQSQLDHANAQLSDNNRKIELLTEQIRIMNQRFLLMIFFHGHPESRRNVLADTKSLDFSMYTSISIKSAQSPLKCGDFCFPALMFEDLR